MAHEATTSWAERYLDPPPLHKRAIDALSIRALRRKRAHQSRNNNYNRTLSPEREALKQQFLREGYTSDIRDQHFQLAEAEGTGEFAWPPAKSSNVTIHHSSEGRMVIQTSQGFGRMNVVTSQDGKEVDLSFVMVDREVRESPGYRHYDYAGQLFRVFKAYVNHLPKVERVVSTISNEATLALLLKQFKHDTFNFAHRDEDNDSWTPDPDMTTEQAMATLQSMRKQQYPNDPDGSGMLLGGLRLTIGLTH